VLVGRLDRDDRLGAKPSCARVASQHRDADTVELDHVAFDVDVEFAPVGARFLDDPALAFD
jgi:hypothetical protein